MEMSNGVASCLFAGICSKIEYVESRLKDWSDTMLEIYIREITEALAFYKVECVISALYLEKRYEKLASLIRERAATKEKVI